MRSNMTGLGFNSTEYRSFNRGIVRGNYKPYRKPQCPPSPQLARRCDLFIEAGKLAVEYLVSHGLLSSNVLSGKWQNGTLRNSSRELKDHRNTRDKEIPSSPIKERAVGNSKSQNDDDLSMDRNSTRESRQPGVSRTYSSDFSQENRNEGSLSERVISTQRLEAENNNGPRDAANDPDMDFQMPHSVELSANDDRDRNQVNEMKKDHVDVDSDLKMSSMSQIKDDSELEKHSDIVDTGCEETKDGAGQVDSEKDNCVDELDINQCEDKHDSSNNNSSDMLKLGGPEKIPTRIRSSLVIKSPNSDRDFISNKESTSDSGCCSLETTKETIINGSSEIPSSKCVTTALSGPSFSNVGAPDTSNDVNQQKPYESLSFTDKTFWPEGISSESLELKRVNSTDKDRGEKRGLIEQNIEEGVKRAKQWLSVSQSGDYTQPSDVSEKRSVLPDNRLVSANVFNGSTRENIPNVSSVDQGEKQFFQSSFRICDLNLMGSSDIHENRDVPSLVYPSVSALTKDPPVGFDLTMNNSSSLNDMYNGSESGRKGIEIIDLESESRSQRDGNNMPPSMEVGMTNLSNFPNNPQNPTDNPDSQNGYSFMISELLDNDDPNCSSVRPEMSSLHNDIGLHHGEGMFAEDDSIYMQLGEIPINLLPVWEQHNQERNPFGL